MSYDSNSHQNPEADYNRPDYANPDSYRNPNTPYDASNPYGQPDTTHDAPNPYAAPAPATPYGTSNAYGAPATPYSGSAPNTPYGIPQNPYGASIPPRHPLPLGEAIRNLPNQYIKVLTRPGAAVFAEEQGKAAWNIIWVQLIVLAIFAALIGTAVFNTSLNNSLGASSAASQQVLQNMRSFSGAFAILFLIFAPIGFFIGTGIYHLLAKAFGGRGTYLDYCYCYLLFSLPLTIVSGIVNLIPYVGSVIGFAISIYLIVLQVFMTMAVHRLTGGKATLAVLILPIIVFVLVIIISIIIVAVIAGASSR